ncbi:hypothetical protein APX70_03058 [Pseudomonas syringae pv. maculicola]|uniref:Uncharacterized protein n=1 Tax=Pseudomonas syringae pv. maculicola TaxID=59511 RepID=A0A3M2V9M1_PSEYM|nr:hypothetical protein APX70_03058 [Pseudomonas syringae pv. maculicola]
MRMGMWVGIRLGVWILRGMFQCLSLFLSGRALITGGIYCLITLFLLHPHVIELYWDLKRGARAMVFTPQRLHLVTVREQLLSKQ